VSIVFLGASLAVSTGFSLGLGCGVLVRDDSVCMSDKGRPSPLPFGEARGGP